MEDNESRPINTNDESPGRWTLGESTGGGTSSCYNHVINNMFSLGC